VIDREKLIQSFGKMFEEFLDQEANQALKQKLNDREGCYEKNH
jgi:hypothetical protein